MTTNNWRRVSLSQHVSHVRRLRCMTFFLVFLSSYVLLRGISSLKIFSHHPQVKYHSLIVSFYILRRTARREKSQINRRQQGFFKGELFLLSSCWNFRFVCQKKKHHSKRVTRLDSHFTIFLT